MKNTQLLLIVCISLFVLTATSAQRRIEISGTVVSSRGAEQKMEVEILNANGEYIIKAITNVDGSFKTTRQFNVGLTIQIRIRDKAFQVFEQKYVITKTGNAGELHLERKQIAISGFVKDSMSEKPLPAAEVGFFEDSKFINSKTTDSRGYYDIETDFNYGQKITVRVSKNGYYPKEQTKTITSDGLNRMDDIQLPLEGTRGLKVFIQVLDKKTGSPLSNVAVRYYDQKTASKLSITTPPNGEVNFRAYQAPGTLLDVEIIKPKYKTIIAKPTLQSDLNNKNEFKFYVEKERKSLLCPILLGSAIVTAGVSGGMFLSSNANADKMNDFSLENRVDFKTQANSKARIGTIAAGVAGGLTVAWILCKVQGKRKDEVKERVSKSGGFTSLVSPMNQADYARTQIGLALSF